MRWLVILALFLIPAACQRPSTRIAYVDLQAVGSLKEGATVKFRGIDIGLVQKLSMLRSSKKRQPAPSPHP